MIEAQGPKKGEKGGVDLSQDGFEEREHTTLKYCGKASNEHRRQITQESDGSIRRSTGVAEHDDFPECWAAKGDVVRKGTGTSVDERSTSDVGQFSPHSAALTCKHFRACQVTSRGPARHICILPLPRCNLTKTPIYGLNLPVDR